MKLLVGRHGDASVDNVEAKFSWSFEVEVLPPGVISAKFAGFKTP